MNQIIFSIKTIIWYSQTSGDTWKYNTNNRND